MIRENITPRGDGNDAIAKNDMQEVQRIRENITPRGDGNTGGIALVNQMKMKKIRENITPRGDGNLRI